MHKIVVYWILIQLYVIGLLSQKMLMKFTKAYINIITLIIQIWINKIKKFWMEMYFK